MQKKKSVVHLAQEDKIDQRKVVVVLQKANLQIATLKKKQIVLLNGEDHAQYIKNKLHKDPADFRPDITHQSLLSLLDSPLNKSGKLQVFITTTTNQVIKINSATKIPRTFKRFGPLMAQLLKRLTIRADQNGQILLKIVQSPVTNHLPEGSIKIALSTKAKSVKCFQFIKQLNVKGPVVFLVGAVAKGNPTMQAGYADDSVCISKYALSASKCIERLLHCFQIIWGIQ